MASNGFRPALLFLSSSDVSTTASISARKLSHGTRSMVRADRPSLTRLASVYRHRKIPADPSSPLRIKISRIRFAQLGRSSYFSRCPLIGAPFGQQSRLPTIRPNQEALHRFPPRIARRIITSRTFSRSQGPFASYWANTGHLREGPVSAVIIIGLDIAKHVFHAHGAD